MRFHVSSHERSQIQTCRTIPLERLYVSLGHSSDLRQTYLKLVMDKLVGSFGRHRFIPHLELYSRGCEPVSVSAASAMAGVART